jgi:hypothetical protein
MLNSNKLFDAMVTASSHNVDSGGAVHRRGTAYFITSKNWVRVISCVALGCGGKISVNEWPISVLAVFGTDLWHIRLDSSTHLARAGHPLCELEFISLLT